MYDVIIIGGGAAGVFAAITAASQCPKANVLILEASSALLSKVLVSGGGRCNVTHACFEPKILVTNYPRGSKELLGPFYTFQPRDMISWLLSRGVPTRAEADGRVFPAANSAQVIVDTFLAELARLGVEVRLGIRPKAIHKAGNYFSVDGIETKKLLIATGSSPEGHAYAAKLGHQIDPPVPALFAFSAPSSPLLGLSGLSVDPVAVHLEDFRKVKRRGAILLTGCGFSGPAIFQLSSFAARFLHERQYKAQLVIDWCPALSEAELFQKLMVLKTTVPDQLLGTGNPFTLPKKLWQALALPHGGQVKLKNIPNAALKRVAQTLHADSYAVEGKAPRPSGFHDEFVHCGGITLKEVQFSSMESKKCAGLYFAGEVLDIDGITGGFNFQNAWTTGYIAGKSSVSCS